MKKLTNMLLALCVLWSTVASAQLADDTLYVVLNGVRWCKVVGSAEYVPDATHPTGTPGRVLTVLRLELTDCVDDGVYEDRFEELEAQDLDE